MVEEYTVSPNQFPLAIIRHECSFILECYDNCHIFLSFFCRNIFLSIVLEQQCVQTFKVSILLAHYISCTRSENSVNYFFLVHSRVAIKLVKCIILVILDSVPNSNYLNHVVGNL